MHNGPLHPARRRPPWLRLVCIVSAVALSANACALSPAARGSPAERTRHAVHLLNRATYGARPQDVAEVVRLGTAAWLDRQLAPAPAVIAQAAPQPEAPRDGARTMVMANGERIVVSPFPPAQNINQLVLAKLERALRSERQLEEVMTDFWFNHFNVSFNKAQVRTTLADYEQHAIRPHVFGRFEDMLLATARHPAMLVYLDNYISTAAPDSSQPQRGGQAARRGLNENYARELLELHTLGADRGYTQRDVIEVARAFTGWGIRTRTAPQQTGTVSGTPVQRAVNNIEFEFQSARHDRREKLVLGKTLPAGRDMEDGLDVLRMLAHHPATADRIATKLVRHFVADEPPPALVAELATVFRQTGGDLRAVTRALFTSQHFYDPAVYRAKFKRPYEYVASALRVTDAKLLSQGLVAYLRSLGHLPYSEAAPTGYPVTADQWASAGAMMNRMKFALALGPGAVQGLNIDAVTLFDAREQERFSALLHNGSVAGAASREALHQVAAAVLQRTLPGVSAPGLQDAIVEHLAQQPRAETRVLVAHALGLVIGSPEFQRY